jgi:surfactin synthase thioesterase subunit
MQWHWGNIGSALAGLSTVIIAIAALVRSPGAVRDFRERQRAQADAARAQAELTREQAKQDRLERMRTLSGWSPGGVEAYTVALVTDRAELERAAAELAAGDATPYVVLRVDEGEYSSINRGDNLRSLIKNQHLVSRAPILAEREALEKGFEVLGVQVAMHYPRPNSSLRTDS